MNEKQIHPEDTKAMLESMEELHKEFEQFTPTQLADRMSKKCHRVIRFYVSSYLFNSYGFHTIKINGNKNKCFIVYDQELIDKIKPDLPAIESRSEAYKGMTDSRYSFSCSKYEIMRRNLS